MLQGVLRYTYAPIHLKILRAHFAQHMLEQRVFFKKDTSSTSILLQHWKHSCNVIVLALANEEKLLTVTWNLKKHGPEHVGVTQDVNLVSARSLKPPHSAIKNLPIYASIYLIASTR